MANGLDWQCCLAGSSETAPRILIFSIAMSADYSFEVKNIEIWVPAFFKQNNSSVATVNGRLFATQSFTYSPFGGTTEPFPRDTIRLLIHREANGLQNVL